MALAISVLALPAAASKPEAPAGKPAPKAAKFTPAGQSAATPAGKATPAALHRADFRVTGASCVACLRRVAQRMRTSPGVLKADVSIFKPYWGLVIYDKKQTTLKQIFDKSIEENVKFADVDDKAISDMPTVILPMSKASVTSG